MKKAGLLVISLLLLVSIFSFTDSLAFVHAEEPFPSAGAEVQKQLGINPENIPATPEELKEKYLVREWGKLIGGLPVIGPVHNFLVANPMIFKILFNHAYEISATFLLILLIWFILAFKLTKVLKSSGILKEAFALPAAFAFTIILAQLNLFNFIAIGITTFMFSQSAWWARALIFTLACGIIIALGYLSDYLSKYLKDQQLANEKEEMKQGIAKSNALIQGIKSGQDLTKR